MVAYKHMGAYRLQKKGWQLWCEYQYIVLVPWTGAVCFGDFVIFCDVFQKCDDDDGQ